MEYIFFGIVFFGIIFTVFAVFDSMFGEKDAECLGDHWE